MTTEPLITDLDSPDAAVPAFAHAGPPALLVLLATDDATACVDDTCLPSEDAE